jgi:hypothetical protein
VSVELHEQVVVPVASLRPHERNYRRHPPEQLEHLVRSLEEHGVYRNVVVAEEGTILAGHGVVEAATAAGMEEIPVIRLAIDPASAQALKIVAGDNELGRLGEVDDRALTEILKEIRETNDGLLGTGFSDEQLANLLYVTRPATEIASFSEAQEWVGMPAFNGVDKPLQIVVSFDSDEDREKFMALIGVERIFKKTRGTWSTWWRSSAEAA